MSIRENPPDVDRVTRSMVALHGGHDDGGQRHGHAADSESPTGTWSKAPDFAADPDRAAAVHAATRRDRDRYLTSGLTPVDCRFCHATVAVKKLGPQYTAVQWNSEASQRCAYFAEVRAGGGSSSRVRTCPWLGDSIKHAVAEGCFEAVSGSPSPGDG
jgi:hypothetical protein